MVRVRGQGPGGGGSFTETQNHSGLWGPKDRPTFQMISLCFQPNKIPQHLLSGLESLLQSQLTVIRAVPL